MVSLTSKKINLEAIVLEVVRILDGNPAHKSRKGKVTKKWSSRVETINSNHILVNHPEGYGLVFELKGENGNTLKIEIRATITFHEENIWERLTKTEREAFHPSLKLIVLANNPPQEIAREIVGKILAHYTLY